MGIIRILLASSVVIRHVGGLYGYEMVDADIAVQAFYIVSGFYMALILNEKYKEKPYRLFITNRLLRLYPSYWAILMLLIASYIIIFILSGNVAYTIALWISGFPAMNLKSILLLLVSNMFLFGQDIIRLLTFNNMAASEFVLVQPAWSLGVELWFYLLAPFLCRKRAGFIISLIGISLMFRFISYGYFELPGDFWKNKFFPFELALFLSGVMGYKLYSRLKPLQPERRHFIKIVFFILYPLVLVTTIFYEFLGINGWVYLLFIAVAIPFIFFTAKNNRVDRFIGELSYPLYLCHFPIIRVFREIMHYGASLSPGITTERVYRKITHYKAFLSPSLAIFLFSLVVALLLYVLIDKRVDAYRQRLAMER